MLLSSSGSLLSESECTRSKFLAMMNFWGLTFTFRVSYMWCQKQRIENNLKSHEMLFVAFLGYSQTCIHDTPKLTHFMSKPACNRIFCPSKWQNRKISTIDFVGKCPQNDVVFVRAFAKFSVSIKITILYAAYKSGGPPRREISKFLNKLFWFSHPLLANFGVPKTHGLFVSACANTHTPRPTCQGTSWKFYFDRTKTTTYLKEHPHVKS